MFGNAIWGDDRMLLNGWTFRIEHNRRNEWNGGDHFRFFKTKELVDAYEAFFRVHQVSAKSIFELGLWDGGSLAFWNEILKPKTISGIDIEDRSDSSYLRRYTSENSEAIIKTHWKTDQADGSRLREILDSDFGGQLDLVFDDASHLYRPTRASFEIVFPYLRPGGLYIIEDWAWKHWESFTPRPEWSIDEPLTKLVVEITEAVGTGRGVIASITGYPGFVAVERGTREVHPTEFRLGDQIYQRPKQAMPYHRLLNRVLWGPERQALFRLKQKIKAAL